MLLRRGLAVVVAAALAGCTASAPRGPRLEHDARRAAEALAAAYERGRAEDFFSRVDKSAFPGYSEFELRVRTAMLENRQVSLAIITDAVVVSSDEAALRGRWNRGLVDRAGNHRLADGECELLFRARPSGGLALTAIHGDSPF